MRRSFAPILATLVLVTVTPGPKARAQAPTTASEDALARLPGSFTARLRARGDSSQQYALYVPSGAREGEPRPVLFAMDPRGRALVPLARLAPTAERLGWIVLSSWNTRSDGPGDPNVRALNAMLDDVQDRLAIDPRRVYLAGFSGTARVAWVIAQQLRGPVAGLLAVGAGLPEEDAAWVRPHARDSAFAVFAAVGRLDFNHDEVVSLDALLEREGVPHRLAVFEGGHAWAPESTLAVGMRWLEVRAMLGARRAVDTTIVRETRAAAMAAARALEAAGGRAEARAAWQGVVADFARWGGIDEASARAAALAADPAVAALLAARERQASADARQRARMATVLREARSGRPRDAASLSRALDVEGLRRVAQVMGDSIAAPGAERLLEWLFAMTSFYEPGEALAARDPARAAVLFDVAASIRALPPELCAEAAKAHRAAGSAREAAAYDRCAASPRPASWSAGVPRRHAIRMR
jgi:predicted esterase